MVLPPGGSQAIEPCTGLSAGPLQSQSQWILDRFAARASLCENGIYLSKRKPSDWLRCISLRKVPRVTLLAISEQNQTFPDELRYGARAADTEGKCQP